MSVFAHQREAVEQSNLLGIRGRVASVTGMMVAVDAFMAPVGAMCRISRRRLGPLRAQVVGFRGDQTLLMPLADPLGVVQCDRVEVLASLQEVDVGAELLGRVLDGMGKPIDGKGGYCVEGRAPLFASPPDALKRPRIGQPLSLGVRSVDSLLTLGQGQRVGIFAGTGVGKSVLLGMIARNTDADVTVVALVGERGREVGDFIAKDLGKEGLRRSVMVVSTSDQSPVLRVRACFVATAIAEYFRDQGKRVLLLMDSLTRVAMAQRQIGLGVGEPPTTKGYPPGVFALLPKMLERSGRTAKGNITGIYTVLVEGDDIADPISDAVRGLLDGHVWLSRGLAERGHYPAIDILESISRVMPDVVDRDHLEGALRVKQLLATWRGIEDLVNIGAYARGSNADFDLAIEMKPKIDAFLRQRVEEGASFKDSKKNLMEIVEQARAAERKLRSRGKAGAAA